MEKAQYSCLKYQNSCLKSQHLRQESKDSRQEVLVLFIRGFRDIFCVG